MAREGKPSLVDIAEEALRRWLASGRHRPGERLPPEQELSANLGISRGTLRTALGRLEESGEIVRRQGSGTYVGKAPSTALDEGLERLVSYSELARRRGVTLELGELTVEEHRLGPEVAEVFGLEPDTPATTITRVLLLDGQPGSWMRDVVHPDVELPGAGRLRQALERGQMVLDLLIKQGVPVAYTRAHILARVLTKRDRVGTRAGSGRDHSRARDRARDLHRRRDAGGALDRRFPPPQPGPPRDALSGGPAAGAGDRQGVSPPVGAVMRRRRTNIPICSKLLL